MAVWLKQSTAIGIALGPFVDEVDGFTVDENLVITQAEVRLKKGAGNWAQKNESASSTHEENGWYEIQLDTTDTNTVGPLMVSVTESGVLPVWREFMVMPANTYDSLVGGTDVLQADVTQIDGNATDGNNATLNLKQLNVVNSAGSAIIATSSSAGNHGMILTGNTTGAGLRVLGGATGAAVQVVGGGTSGDGIDISTTDGHGVDIGAAGVKNGINSVGGGGGYGASLTGGSLGAGVVITGGAASDGFVVQGNGDGYGFRVIAGSNSDAVNISASAGHGVSIEAAGASKHGVLVTGGSSGTSDGIKAVAGTGGVPIRGNITGNITGNLSGTVGSLATQAKADVNAEVVDVIRTDTNAEPGQGAPPATATLEQKVDYLYKAWRNKTEQTATQYSLYDDAGTTIDQKATVSDDATTATKGEVGTGA
jgi:hypothetical protein